MKLSLGAVLARLAPSAASAVLGIAMITGCVGSAPTTSAPVAANSAATPVGTTTITGAMLAPSGLAPAAWDPDEVAPNAPSAASAPSILASPVARPTWGTAVVDAPTN